MSVRMLFSHGLILGAAATSVVPALADGQNWQRFQIPYVSAFPQLVADNGIVYVSGGTNTEAGAYAGLSDQIWSFNLTSQQWHQASARLPYGLATDQAGKAVGELILIGPSLGPTMNNGWPQHNKMIEYNTVTDEARETAAFPYSVAGAVPVNITSVQGQARVYTFGAWNGTTSYRDIFRYDPVMATLTKLTTASLAYGDAAYCSGTDAQGNILIFGEYPNWLRWVEKFDPQTETITSYGNILPEDVGGSRFCWTNVAGQMFVADLVSKSIYGVDPTTMTFSAQPWSLPDATPDYTLNPYVGAYDSTTNQLILSESKWTGTTWDCNLIVGQLPSPPASPNPTARQVDQPVSTTLSWSEATPGVTFDVYLDVANPPQGKVASGLTAPNFTPSLVLGTKYYWRVVAINGVGQTQSPVWTFGTHIPGDIDGDGNVNLADLKILVGNWNRSVN